MFPNTKFHVIPPCQSFIPVSPANRTRRRRQFDTSGMPRTRTPHLHPRNRGALTELPTTLGTRRRWSRYHLSVDSERGPRLLIKDSNTAPAVVVKFLATRTPLSARPGIEIEHRSTSTLNQIARTPVFWIVPKNGEEWFGHRKS